MNIFFFHFELSAVRFCADILLTHSWKTLGQTRDTRKRESQQTKANMAISYNHR